MYSGSFTTPAQYSVRETPASTKLNDLIISIRQQTEAITTHQHTGGNDGTKIEVYGLANNINATSIAFNADQIDGIHASTSPVLNKLLALNSVAKFPLSVLYTGSGNGLDADKLDGYHAGNSSGNIPLSNGTVNTNLNADLLDGKHASNSVNQIPISNGNVNANLNADKLDGYHASNSAYQVPISNSSLCTYLNADMVDGYHLTNIFDGARSSSSRDLRVRVGYYSGGTPSGSTTGSIWLDLS